MHIFLVKLLVSFLQNMIWIANMFFDGHCLQNIFEHYDTMTFDSLALKENTTLPFLVPSLLKVYPSSLTPPEFPHMLAGF